jgi:hypothetical protein
MHKSRRGGWLALDCAALVVNHLGAGLERQEFSAAGFAVTVFTSARLLQAATVVTCSERSCLVRKALGAAGHAGTALSCSISVACAGIALVPLVLQ